MKRMLLALLALLSFGGTALAQALAPGEITLAVEVLGLAPPDRASLVETLRGRGPDEAAAKADLARQRSELTAKLGRSGIPASAIKFGDVTMEPDYSVEAAVVADAASEGAAAAAAEAAADAAADEAATTENNGPRTIIAPAPYVPPRSANQTVTISISDLTKIEAVQEAFPLGESRYRRPQAFYSTSDEKGAHSRAVADALARARAEADTYAAALGMRVVRIIKVSSDKPGLNWPDLMQWFGKMDDRGSPSEDNFRRLAGSAFAGAKVEFVIAPK